MKALPGFTTRHVWRASNLRALCYGRFLAATHSIETARATKPFYRYHDRVYNAVWPSTYQRHFAVHDRVEPL